MHLTVPPAFHPASSLLGRAVRRWATDAHQAESLYIFAAALVLVAATLAGQWGWVLWGTEGENALGVVAAQVVGGMTVGALCIVGWRPRLHVRVGEGTLHVARGKESLVLLLAGIEVAERIPAEAYHRHWRRYAATRAFVNRLPEELLLLRTEAGPVVLGLPAADLARLEAHLAERIAEPAAALGRAA